MKETRRSSSEIRLSLAANRARLDHDLEELGDRVEESLSPRQILARHPALVTIAGVIVGVLVVRNPAFLGRSLVRIAQAAAPLVVGALLKRDGSAPAQPT